ncbi:MAG: Rieske 2Fe-2S domain-containing protein [Candidatus Sericytochromatia bacterium]
MRLRTDQQNLHTQPPSVHPVFNNWDVVTEGWYILCRSRELALNQVLTRDLGSQKICVFRDSRGQVHAMDGFCPHMGVDLGIGKVVNDRVQCFFHHWEFDASGQCQHIPVQKEIPKRACLPTYAAQERYGYIWVHPDPATATQVLVPPGLEGLPITVLPGKAYERRCHYHITMINGIDPQHLRTVHDIHMDMEIAIAESGSVIEIVLTGQMPETTPRERLARRILGDSYSYAMKYADGCVAALTLLKDVTFWGKAGLLPELYMIFAYQQIAPGRTLVQPLFLTRERPGLWGKLVSRFWLAMTQLAFGALQGEDGQVYENIRFTTRNLLAVDAPVAKYIQYINRLKPSKWGKQLAERPDRRLPQAEGERFLALQPSDEGPVHPLA